MFRYRSCYLILLLPPANEVWGKVTFSEACVKNSVHRGEGGLPQCMLGYNNPPRTRQAPPWPGTPPGPGTPGTRQAGTPSPRTRHPPRARHPSGPGTAPPRTRHHPPRAEHAGRYGQRAGGTHPTVMHSCLEICCQVNSGTYI